MVQGTLVDLASVGRAVVLDLVKARRGAGVLGHVLYGPAAHGDFTGEILLLEVTRATRRVFHEEELTDRLPDALPGRLFLISVSRLTFDELLDASDPRLLALLTEFEVLSDATGAVARALRAAKRRLRPRR